MASLTLVNLVKRFSTGLAAVNNINIDVADGEFVCFLGPSGCGKSTALRMISGFETPTSGDILIDGQSVIDIPANSRPTAMVFQKYTLWPHMTVYNNIAFGLRLRRLSKIEIDRKVFDSLEMVGLSRLPIDSRHSFPAGNNSVSPLHARWYSNPKFYYSMSRLVT